MMCHGPLRTRHVADSYAQLKPTCWSQKVLPVRRNLRRSFWRRGVPELASA